jgi:hypothetical protein
MTGLQCGLCLSCGVPFLPDVSRVDFFNRQGVLSVLFLNSEFTHNRDIQQAYTTPKFSSGVDQAHVFHRSHHATAIEYMCERHTRDSRVGGGAIVAGNVIPDQANAAMLYHHAPTSQGNRQPRAATWDRPPLASRLNMRRLRKFVLRVGALPNARVPAQNLDQTYATCEGCNDLMTQKAGIAYVLGYGVAGARNVHGGVIQGQPVREYVADAQNHTLANAYGNWQYGNVPAAVVPRPDQTTQDSTAPHVAYYLHMCLPYKVHGQRDVFEARIANAAVRRQARAFYLEQCWLILEIASLATLLEEGPVMNEPNTRRAHGMHQLCGSLDLYVSFFLFRLLQFEHFAAIRTYDLDFVQWHQRYYWDAINCPGLFGPNERRVLIAQRMYGTTAQPGGTLVTQICERLMSHYRTRLLPLVRMLALQANVLPAIEDFFVAPPVLRELRALTRRVGVCVCWFGACFLGLLCFGQLTETDFQTALGEFGINALLFRIVRLCMDYPREFRDQVLDFRVNWQRREVAQVPSLLISFLFSGR